ncbi:MAG TPA: peptidylprolyl isomerase, partial [Salinivirgaceae bacterium]|nr:peptidylprolyl isomerase [Salinivirgaceae bacterium]
RYQKGMPFEQLALVYSQDPSAKRNLGELGYFSAMRMVYPFENAAFQTPVGGISGPVRTQFGYHLVKVTDTLTIEGPIDLQFVVIPVRPNDTANTALAKISLAYQQALIDDSFSNVVQSFTEDQNSKAKNGMLTNYEPGKMSPEFDSIAFRLKEKEISKPFFSRYNNAWFIVYIVKKHKHPSYDEALDNIKRRVSRMPHANIRSKKLAEHLMTQYKTVRNEKAYAEVVDTLIALTTSKRNLTSDMANILNKPILTINDTSTVSQYEFLRFVFQKLKLETDNMKLFCNEMWPEFLERQIINYEDQILPFKYPEFAQILREYHDGILLFNITDSVVWQRAMIDTVGLNQFFGQISDRYRWNTRYDSYIITLEQKEKAPSVEKVIKKAVTEGGKPEEILQRVQQKLNDSTLNLRIDKIVVEKGQNRYVDQTKLKKGFYRLDTNEGIAVWCYIANVIPPQPKKLSEVRGYAVAEYQNYLEQKWIEQLRKKYPVTVHYDVLETLIKK